MPCAQSTVSPQRRLVPFSQICAILSPCGGRLSPHEKYIINSTPTSLLNQLLIPPPTLLFSCKLTFPGQTNHKTMIHSRELVELLVSSIAKNKPVNAIIASVGLLVLFSIALGRANRGQKKPGIPGRLGLPFLGETFSFLSATNSTKGCYEFVRLRRSW